jgi:hypothetical protein
VSSRKQSPPLKLFPQGEALLAALATLKNARLVRSDEIPRHLLPLFPHLHRRRPAPRKGA